MDANPDAGPETAALPFTLDELNDYVATAFPGNPNRCVEIGPTFAVVAYEVTDLNIRPGGFISGPSQFGAVDAALWYVTWAAIGRIEPMALTSELSIRYLRPAQGEVLYARADLESVSRRSVVATAHVWCDDRRHKPTAAAQGTYALPMT